MKRSSRTAKNYLKTKQQFEESLSQCANDDVSEKGCDFLKAASTHIDELEEDLADLHTGYNEACSAIFTLINSFIKSGKAAELITSDNRRIRSIAARILKEENDDESEG